MIWFIIGAFVGGWFGFALAAVLAVSKKSERGGEDYAVVVADYLRRSGVPKWIRVRDYLPDDEELLKNSEFLVVIEGAGNPTTLLFDGEGWVDDWGGSYPVSHWMPLPDMPEEVKR